MRHLAFISAFLAALMVQCHGLSPHHQECSNPAGTGQSLFVTAPQEQEAADAPQHTPRQICATNATQDAWTCSNWAGTVTWSPSGVFAPADEQELAAFLQSAAAAAANNASKRPTMKVVGFAHSWAGIYLPAKGADGTPGTTVALHKLAGITNISASHVEVLAGTSFAQVFSELDAQGLALAWSPGGIQGLTVGGAVSVGFHGSQMSVGGVSSVVRALRVYDTAGNAHELSDDTHPEAMKAARMGLGMCGIISRVSLPVVPQFHMRRRRWRVNDVNGFLDEQLPQLKATYDRFHWYLHPYSSSAWPMYWELATAADTAAEARPCRTAVEQFEDAQEKEFGIDGLPLIMRWDNCSDASHRALTHAVDMEQQPLWNGELYVALDNIGEAAATREILQGFQAVAESMGLSVPSQHLWLHVRYVAGDTDSYMNPCYGSAVCAAFELALVAPSMHAPLPPWDEWAAYFGAMEDVLRNLGGRPHHAKYYSGTLPDRPAFGLPVKEFVAECEKFDPEHLLRNDAFDRLYVSGGTAQQRSE